MKRDALLGIAAIALTALFIAGGYHLFFKLGSSLTTLNRLIWVGDPAPDVELEEYGTGRMVSLSSLRGHRAVINFWLAKCGTCIEELPVLEDFYNEYKEEILFYAVNAGESVREVHSFVDKYNPPYPILLDKQGKAFTRFGATGVPETVFIDNEAVIQHWIIGEASAGDLEEGLEKFKQIHQEEG